MNFLRLPMKYDLDKLKKDLSSAEKYMWKKQRASYQSSVLTSSKEGSYTLPGKWDVICLRTPGGNLDRQDPGGVGLVPYKDTDILNKMPYIKSILKSLNTDLLSVRLSALKPGAIINEHCDTYMHFKFGKIRLHIPIITNPKVEMVIGGEKGYFTPGELWFGDFAQLHRVKNKSKVTRVHLLIDVIVNREILKLFPKSYLKKIGSKNILFTKKPKIISPLKLKKYECNFAIYPALLRGFLDNEDTIYGEQIGRVRLKKGRLVVSISGVETFSLYPVSKHEFYISGGNACLSYKFVLGKGQVKKIILVMRYGALRTNLNFPIIN